MSTYRLPTDEWRHSERDALLEFAAKAAKPAGFGYLDAEGNHQDDHGLELWINGRFTHVMACEVLRGNEEARPLLDLGMKALTESLWDDKYAGWLASVHTGEDEAGMEDGRVLPFDEESTRKQSYAHAFVILAAASAMQAGHPAARRLFDVAHELAEYHWWEPVGLVRESASRDWSEFEDYRGINANMHTVEAMLASFDASHDLEYLERALHICRFVISRAEPRQWRIPEHYTSDWTVDPDYNRDRPADKFRPWGATVGHGLEWGRLIIQTAIVNLRHRKIEAGEAAELVSAALHLIDRAVTDGWAVDGHDGFVYTTDFDGQPIVHERMHWVVCEAINAVHAARRALEELGEDAPELTDLNISPEKYAELEAMWWQHADDYFIASPGRWREELDKEGRLSEQTWTGMPEIYHAYQSLVLPDGDYAVGFAAAAKAD